MTPGQAGDGIERRAARAVDAAVAQLADALRAEFPRAEIETGTGEVAIQGGGLREAPALRWPGGLFK